MQETAGEDNNESVSGHVRVSGVEWNGMEWNGMEWNGMEWNGSQGNGREWKAGLVEKESQHAYTAIAMP